MASGGGALNVEEERQGGGGGPGGLVGGGVAILIAVIVFVVTRGGGDAQPSDPAALTYAAISMATDFEIGAFPGYEGCYKDDDPNNRKLPDRKYDVDHFTPETCNTACAGYTYFGLQYYGECYCGNGPDLGESAHSSECFFPCTATGTPDIVCGGGGRNSVYKVAANAVREPGSCGALDESKGTPALCVTATVSNSGDLAGTKTVKVFSDSDENGRVERGSVVLSDVAGSGSAQAKVPIYMADIQNVDGAFKIFVGDSSTHNGGLEAVANKVDSHVAAVQCPGSETYCDATMCCPGSDITGGRTFPCPIADFATASCQVTGEETVGVVLSALMAAMTRKEKQRFLKGTGWFGETIPLKKYYIGNAGHGQRFGIPTQNMQDSGNGFRNDIVGQNSNDKYLEQVTSWPVALAIASIWSTTDFGRYGQALGAEFRKKGANMLLGPAVNVHRVPRCGRNAEYLSGESPYLGARLTKPYIRGVQSQKVLASVKHFINNNQESCRHSSDSITDDRTRWELYYPPFEAAVQADVAMQMCGYNFVNGEKNCQSKKIMQEDLKDTMGFKGWVQSDWWALNNYTAAIEAGIDQEMPGHLMANGAFDYYFTDERLDAMTDDRVNHMLKPQLEKMLQYGLFQLIPSETCRFGGGCDDKLYDFSVTDPAREAFSKELTQKAVTLLKNEDGALPLGNSVTKIALLGSACHQLVDPDYQYESWVHNSYYFIGGSGRVIGHDPVSIYTGLKEKCPGFDNGYQGCYRDDESARKLPEKKMDSGATPELCRAACVGFTYFGLQFNKECFCGNGPDLGVRGLEGECAKPCDAEPGLMCGGALRNSVYTVAVPAGQSPSCEIVTEFTDNVDAALAKANDTDVAILCAGVTSTEDADRTDLSVVEEEFVVQVTERLAAEQKKVVLTMTAGTIVMPWIDNVDAAMNLFLPGKHAGTAFADALFGDINPSAKTPISYPKLESDTIQPCACEGYPAPCEYTEKLMIAWYGMTADKILFPFGHGLSYTTFAHTNLVVHTDRGQVSTACPEQDPDLGAAIVCVTAQVQNDAQGRVGVEVAQMYMGFPGGLEEPEKVLRGFHRTAELQPGSSEIVRFPLYRRDIQTYSNTENGWENQAGTFTIHVGTSAGVTPLSGSFIVSEGGIPGAAQATMALV